MKKARARTAVALRVCRDCGLEAYIEEDLDLFAKNKNSKYGRDNICIKCSKERNKKYLEENSEKIKERRKKRRVNNLEFFREREKAYREANKKKFRERSRKYREANPFKMILSGAKSRSNRKRLDFDLDLEYLKQLWDECGGICSMTGIQMHDKSGVNNPYSVSLDRIIPDKGYIKGNVRLVSLWYNVSQSNWGNKVVIEMCQRVVERARSPIEEMVVHPVRSSSVRTPASM